MNASIIDIGYKTCFPEKGVSFTLSLRPLVNYLENRLKTEDTLKKEFYRFLLEKIKAEKSLLEEVDVETLVQHKDVLELVYTILTPLMANEKDLYWALSTPVPDKIFFSTNIFYDFLELQISARKQENQLKSQEEEHLVFLYRMILERFYKYQYVNKNEILYTFHHPETQLTSFYNIHSDTRFVDIHYQGELPEIDFEELAVFTREGKELEYLQAAMPIERFTFDGFSIISLSDVTFQHSIEGIRNALVNHAFETETYENVIHSLRALSGNGYMEFGLLPFLKVNDKFVLDIAHKSQSILINSGTLFNVQEESFQSLIADYKDHPHPIFFKDLNDESLQKFSFLSVLKANNVTSYAVLPVYYHLQLAGVMEVYTREEVVIDEKIISRLHPAMPLLGQLFQYRIDEFNSEMDEVLKDKFTALQPSVQWKFNEAVWNFLKKEKKKWKTQEVDTVTFKGLYPLFGAIDIRNSTTERNVALRSDLKLQLAKLVETLTELQKITPLDLIRKLLFEAQGWQERINSLLSSSEEGQLNEFLELEVHPVLKHLAQSQTEISLLAGAYFECIDPQQGGAFENRRQLERSMQLINNAVSEFLEEEQTELQALYPSYFAKFRTDGIEYDLYIGQSIAPSKQFDLLYLKNTRIWQLTAMVEIARLTNNLVTRMPRPLLTTQLIFIHSNPIDISFRNDERRFDVEGAYNIRYEVIKKRIDKVAIKGTGERLTQPGKIALVYFHAHEALEYQEYLFFLQNEGYLLREVEYLELEEVQGVSGLKAMRVSVNYASGEAYDEKCESLQRKLLKGNQSLEESIEKKA